MIAGRDADGVFLLVDIPKKTATASEALMRYLAVPLHALRVQPGDPGHAEGGQGQLNAADWLERAMDAALVVPHTAVTRLAKTDARWVHAVSSPDWEAWLLQQPSPAANNAGAANQPQHAARDRTVMGHVRCCPSLLPLSLSPARPPACLNTAPDHPALAPPSTLAPACTSTRLHERAEAPPP